MRLLLVEDNERLRALTAGALKAAGFDIDTACSAAEAEGLATALPYAAIILDLGLPDEDGLALLKRLRAGGRASPVLILTARGGVLDRVAGLDAGADDYLIKPFAMEELLARIRVLLRRAWGMTGDRLGVGALSFDVRTRETEVRGKVRPLPPRESAVLELLLRRAGRVVPKRLVEDQLFGLSGEGGANAIEVYVHRLRRFLADEAAGLRIDTVRGVGYVLSAEGKWPPPSAAG
ncbi:MAG TPA: response regulator [Acetobacteraceae bacterium]|nr:response regulator [Acetobacteraceae bacterium]